MITGPSVLTAEFSTAAQERAKGQEQLVLLPNPATDHLRITSEGTILNILVIAADGREVLLAAPNTQSSLIDVSGLSVGPYVVLSTLNDGTLQRGRFIKQ
ncbi:MAG: T9SS type A sorting domain-containing protein [Flavobacteriales bacterium]|nr:T9SS type A sorting domain-containing protein [Flavobacteriales bacterium]